MLSEKQSRRIVDVNNDIRIEIVLILTTGRICIIIIMERNYNWTWLEIGLLQIAKQNCFSAWYL